MGILVPKGSKVSQELTKKVKEQEKEKIYLDFIERFVLEKGEKTGRESIAKLFVNVELSKRRKALTEKEQQELSENYKKVADEILEVIGESEAEIATFTFSKGGSKTSLEKGQLQSLKEKGAKVEYTAIMVNGIVVLEPVGQADNATYILDASSNEKIDVLKNSLEAIKDISRKQAMDLGLMYQIKHDISEGERI